MQTIIGMFSRKDEAQKAVMALQRAGISPADIRLIDQEDAALRAEAAGEPQSPVETHARSGWRAGLLTGLLLGAVVGLIFGLGILALPALLAFLPTALLPSVLAWALIGALLGALIGLLFHSGAARYSADKATQRRLGERTLVSVQVDDAQANRVIAFMRSLNPLSIERTSGSWSAEPFTGFDLQSGPAAVPVTGQHANIATIHEELQVGTREVPGQRKRISTYVETEPTEKEVALRQERIELERQRAERDLTDADLQKFQPFVESSIELTEIVEIPYARKQAEVVEEVRVSKTVEHRQEKVKETLRHQDVKVEDLAPLEWRDYERNFRQHYEKTFQQRRDGQTTFQEYLPAYHFGFDLAQDKSLAQRSWDQVEPVAQQQWQERGAQTAWDEAKQAVRYAWETVTQTTE